jgi:hypothetical protein
MLQGSSMGIFAMLLLTLAMLGAFAAFFVTLARRAAQGAATRTDTEARGSHLLVPERGASR